MVFKPPHKNIQVWMKQRGQKSSTFGIRTYLTCSNNSFCRIYGEWLHASIYTHTPTPVPLMLGSNTVDKLNQKHTKSMPRRHSVWVVYTREKYLWWLKRGESVCLEGARDVLVLLAVLKEANTIPCKLANEIGLHQKYAIIDCSTTDTANLT